MKYVKTLGLVAVTAIAAMALAAPASATEVTSPKGTTYTGEIVAEAQGGGIVIHPPMGSITCQDSIVKGAKVEQQGSAVTAKGAVTAWTIANCNATVTVLKKGTLEIHATGGGNATVTHTGMEITAVFLGFHCVFSTNNTDIGVLTGDNSDNAEFEISATIPRTGGSSGAFCGSTSALTGEYEITTPSTLSID